VVPSVRTGQAGPAADSSPPRQVNAQAVLLVLGKDTGLRVLVQLRSKHMPVMPGYLGTIGGCRGRTDLDSRQTALREVTEETGLSAGLMFPPVKFAEGAKVDWFAMQLGHPEFRGKQDSHEVDDIQLVLGRLPASATKAECFGHAWVPVCDLDQIDPTMPLMGGMLRKINHAVDHLGLRRAAAAPLLPTNRMALPEDPGPKKGSIEVSSDSGCEADGGHGAPIHGGSGA